MKCRSCQKDLGSDYSGTWCTYCGGELEQSPEAASPNTLPPADKARCWTIFWLALLGGPALAFLSLASNNIAVFLVFILGGGAIAGFALARMFSRTIPGLIVKGIGFCILGVVILAGIAFVGCVAALGKL